MDEIEELIRRLKSTDPELSAIAQNESSGGTNLNFPQVKSGLNKGQKAGGPFGMMPLTAQELLKRNPQLAEEYPDIQQASPEHVTEILNSDPDGATDLARQEFLRRMNLFGGDKEKAAHSWLNGASGTMEASPEEIQKSEYVQKFLRNLPRTTTGGKEVP